MRLSSRRSDAHVMRRRAKTLQEIRADERELGVSRAVASKDNSSLGAPIPPPQPAGKTCSCGRHFSMAEWSALNPRKWEVDETETLEMIDCPSCHSTISLPVPR